MVSITIMLVIANVQTNINDSVPKTSYLKMIDYFLIYSFNIIILVMVYHTYQVAHIAEEFEPTEKEKVSYPHSFFLSLKGLSNETEILYRNNYFLSLG